MKVIAVQGAMARVQARGAERDVSLLLLDEPVTPGEFVLVHLGHARMKMDRAEAQATWDLLDEMLEAEARAAKLPA